MTDAARPGGGTTAGARAALAGIDLGAVAGAGVDAGLGSGFGAGAGAGEGGAEAAGPGVAVAGSSCPGRQINRTTGSVATATSPASHARLG
jgi:hypothetical protein